MSQILWIALLAVLGFLIKDPVIDALGSVRDDFYQQHLTGRAVTVEPKRLEFIVEGSPEQKSFRVSNTRSEPRFSIRAFIRTSKAIGQDFDIAEFGAPPTRVVDYSPDRQNIAYFFPIKVDDEDAILMYIPRLDGRKQVEFRVQASKTSRLDFGQVECDTSDPGIKVELGQKAHEVPMTLPARLKNKNFTMNGMKVIILQNTSSLASAD